MLKYLIVDDNGKIIGKSARAGEKHVSATVKPFQKNARWNGNCFDYGFSQPQKEIYTKPYLRSAISEFYKLLTAGAHWLNGKETRKHDGKISVLIPCYKQSKYVMTAVKSCLKQSQKPTEVIVLLMDNDSYALEPQLKEMGITCCIEPQMNVSKARTYLVDKCKTDWFVFLDADDFLLHDFIEKIDKVEGAYIKPSVVFLDEKKLGLNQFRIERARPEMSVYNNLTGLMHKDVFYDIGLKEEYSKGGEDFDFMLRLWASRKWKITFIEDSLYVYLDHNDKSSLTSYDDCFKSLFKCLVDNKDFLIKEILYSKDVYFLLKEKWLLENPTEENLSKYAIALTIQGRDVYSEMTFFEEYIQNEFDYWCKTSQLKSTAHTYSKEDYVFINCDTVKVDEYELEATSFDAVILNVNPRNIESFVTEEKSLIIHKDIWAEIKDKYSPIDLVFYLLKNYSCVVENISNITDAKLRTKNESFINALPDIHFDKEIEKSVGLLLDYYSEGMFTTVDMKYLSATFILHKNCNADCPYCYYKGEHAQMLSDEKMYENFDRALTHFEKLIGKMGNAQLIVHIMGGEPTFWSDWLQNKILERLENYRYFYMFTNGYNKKSPLYVSEKCFKIVHIINWQEELKKDLQFFNTEQPVAVIQESELKDIDILEKYNGKNIKITPCKNNYKNNDNCNIDFMKKLADINNTDIDNGAIKTIVSRIEKESLENVRKNCLICPVVRNIDCGTMRVYPCCNGKTSYPLEEYDFTKKADWDKDCSNCTYIY